MPEAYKANVRSLNTKQRQQQSTPTRCGDVFALALLTQQLFSNPPLILNRKMSSTALTTQLTPKTSDTPAILPAAPTPPTGTWRHPRLDDIARRQSASIFGQRNLRRAAVSIGCLIATFYIIPLIPNWLKYASNTISNSSTAHPLNSARALTPPEALPFVDYALYLLRAFLTINLLYSLSPLYARPDSLTDIPLTPTQRHLLGLAPSSVPETPGSAYVTPPRYARSTSRSASSSRAATVGSTTFNRSPSGSPLSGSPLAGRGVGNASVWGAGSSPISVGGSGSPWVRKAVEGRRLSSGGRLPQGSPLAREMVAFDESLGGLRASSLPGSPTPGGRGGASVGLNSKWIYQRRESGGRAVYS